MTYKLSVYTGPTQVHAMALKFGALPDAVVTVEGTERVHLELTTEGRQGLAHGCLAFLDSLRSAYDTTFGLTWRDVQVLGEVTR